jgi:ABC-2 type transport system permease protein
MYLLSVTYFGIFFLASSFWYDPEWFKNNMWARRLNILLCFSSVFYPWKQVSALMPWMGRLLLLNPLTYITEGMRAALLTEADYLPLIICIPVTLFFICIDCWRLSRGIQRQLDPV